MTPNVVSCNTKLLRITTVPVSIQTLLRGQHRFMSHYYEVVGISSSGPELEQVAVDEGIRILPLEMSRTIAPLKDFVALWKLCGIIRKEKPQVVHTHTPKAGILGMLAAWLCRVPVRLHTVAGLPLLEAIGVKRTLLDFVERVTYACATRIYPNSYGLKAIILQSNYCAESKLYVIGNGSSNGIDTEHFSAQQIPSVQLESLKADIGIRASDFVFIFVGRLVRDKGINEMARAFEKVHQQYPNTKLLLVGHPEPEQDPLKPETERVLNSHPAVVLSGYQNDVRPWFAMSQALVFPSYREGFPNVVMQAGAMGLPSIVTDINGCNEIIKNEYNGLIIPPKNQEAIEEAMIRLLEDQELTKRLASHARESIVYRFEQQTVWQLIKEEYDKQLSAIGLN